MSNIEKTRRRQFVGASEIASVFSVDLKERGQQVRASRFQLWAEKSGLEPSTFTGNERTEWGNYLESGIATGVGKRFGWTVKNVRRYMIHSVVDRMGCSPDYEILNHPMGPGWLELKNVDRSFYSRWPTVEASSEDEKFFKEAGVPFSRKRKEPPLSLQLQVQHQLACSNRSWGTLGILVGGNELVMQPYPRVQVTIDRMEAEIPLFWAEVDMGTPPPIDWSADSSTVARLYGYCDPLKVRNMRSDSELLSMAEEYQALGVEISQRTKRRDQLKAMMLAKIGEARKAFLAKGFTISAPNVVGTEINYYREPYRAFRVNRKQRR